MARRYERPPLTEALCEFQFESSQGWDWTIPGLVYERIRADFPTKREKSLVEFSIQGTGMPEPQQFRPGVDRLQFFREDESGIVQVGPNLLAVNQLIPYAGWESFRPLILGQLEHYRSIANPDRLRRVVLRYINKVGVPATQFDLAEYFQALPGLPSDLAGNVTAFFTTSDLGYDDPPMRLKLTFGTASSDSPESSQFLMDLEMASTEGLALEIDAIDHWLETAHERIERAFDSSFTERTHREVFGQIDG